MYTKDYFPEYKIGKGTYGRPSVLSWGEDSTLEIGAFCSISDGVTIFLGGEHRTDWVTTYPFSALWDKAAPIKGHPKSKGNVFIGNDVWIGRNVTIMSGVNISNGAVLGCGALITKDVAPYTIVGGNPAKVIKKRFSEEVIRRLQIVKWWDWEDSKIESVFHLLLNEDIEKFLVYAENKMLK